MIVPRCRVIHVELLKDVCGLTAQHVSICHNHKSVSGCEGRGTGWSLWVLNCPGSWTDWTQHDSYGMERMYAVDA